MGTRLAELSPISVCSELTEQVSSQLTLFAFTGRGRARGDFPLALSRELCLPSSVKPPMFWECCELPLGLSNAVTHLSGAGGLSGNLHFSQSLLALLLAKGLPEFHGFRPVTPNSARAGEVLAIQNENFLFIIQTFLPVSSKHS